MVLIKETLAMVLIGDAVLGLARPRRHLARWQVGPWAPAMQWGRQRPTLTRALAAGELAIGLWYASRVPARTMG